MSSDLATTSRRCFVALPLPDDAIEWLTRRQSTLHRDLHHPALRWVRPEQMHLTLLFLGEVEVEQLQDLQAALMATASAIRSFHLSVGGLGCFPNRTRPKVLWCGLQGDEESLHNLQKRVAESVNRFAERPDNKPFHPHLTLARVKFEDKQLNSQIARILAANPTEDTSPSWAANEVLLMSSELRREGAIYSVLQRAPLAI